MLLVILLENITIIRKFEKRKVSRSFIDNIWYADFADMQLISKLCCGQMLLVILMVRNIMLKHNILCVLLRVGLIKKGIIQISEFFPEPKSLGERVKVELDLSSYETKSDLKNAAGADTSTLAKKVNLGNLKSKVHKLDIDKLKNVPTNLSNLKSKVDKLDDQYLFLLI